MFDIRGTAVSLTFFILLYCAFSMLVVVAWRSLRWLRTTQQSLALLLVTLRILPLAAAVFLTLVFVVPSFQLLEPRSPDISEGVGTVPLALGVSAFLLIGYGAFRVIRAQKKASLMVSRWLKDTSPRLEDAGAETPTFRSRPDAPPLLLVGIRKPRVLISESAVEVLTSGELRIALKHELAHMRAHDNLKRLLFRSCPFPGMAKLENAWSQAAEFASDDAAVAKVDDAVDLAAALVKLSRLLPIEAAPVCTVGFVTGSISARVSRLLTWDEAETCTAKRLRFSSWYAIPLVLVVLSSVLVTYAPALALTHEVTEWLVR